MRRYESGRITICAGRDLNGSSLNQVSVGVLIFDADAQPGYQVLGSKG